MPSGGTTNSILREVKYFQTLTKRKGNILKIIGYDVVIASSGRAIITLPMGTTITIEDALLYIDSTHTLLSYRDIHKNGYHIKTHTKIMRSSFSLQRIMDMVEILLKEFPQLHPDCTILT